LSWALQQGGEPKRQSVPLLAQQKRLASNTFGKTTVKAAKTAARSIFRIILSMIAPTGCLRQPGLKYVRCGPWLSDLRCAWPETWPDDVRCMSERRGLIRAAVVLFLAILGLQATSQPGTAAGTVEEPIYLPAGVSDAAGTVGCLRTPEGGVQAVDLATGRSLWRTDAPARALMIARGRAYVLEERAGRPLRVAAYDARSGRLQRAYDLATLALPPWASLSESGGGRQWTVFEVTARLASDGLEIRYDATRMQAYGFRPADAVGQAQGMARIALGSGRVSLKPGAGPPPPPLSEPAPPMPGARLVAVHARAPGSRLALGGPPADVAGALIVGDLRLAFELSPDTKVVIVHRWRVPGDGRERSLRLEHGHATDAVWATTDRRHVLLRRVYEQPWYDLFSLETGAPIGSLERPVEVAVLGPRVYWTTLEPAGDLVVVASEAGSDRVLWRRTVLRPERHLEPPIP